MDKIELFLEEWIYPYIPESLTTRAILIGSAVGLIVYHLTKKRYRLPPGPRAYPLVGNILALRGSTLYKSLREWSEQFGPVIRIGLGPVTWIVLNDYDVIHEAFVKKSVDFAGRPNMYSVKQMTEGNKDIAFSNYGPTWNLHRRLGLRALKFYMKGEQFVKLIGEVLDGAISHMHSTEDGAFDIYPYAEMIIFNLISKICFDEMFEMENHEAKRFLECMTKMNDAFSTGVFEDMIPLLRLYPTSKFRNVMSMNQEILAFLYKRVNHHRSTFTPDVQRDFTDALLAAQREMYEENPNSAAEIDDTHFAQTINDVFQAGIDSSRQTLYWTLLYVAAHPHVQEKLHRELDQVMGDRTHPLLSDREKLVYTEAVLCESMRLGSVSPLTIPHVTTCDTTIGQYEIPKGTTVFANLYEVHHNPKNWEDPETFNPERFINDNGKITKPEKWIPFSLGKRACMAENLAKPQLQLVIAGLFRNLEVSMPEGVTADIEPKDNFALISPKPYKVVVKSRTR